MNLRNPTLLLLCFLILSGCRTIDKETVKTAKMTPAEFSVADTDGDGKLTKKEAAKHQHREALAEFDLDDDGKISAAEWAAARPSAGENDPHFNALDKNSDGTIEEDEAILFITEHVSFSDQFRKLDQNGDFSLHWEEIDAGVPGSLSVTLFSIHPDA